MSRTPCPSKHVLPACRCRAVIAQAHGVPSYPHLALQRCLLRQPEEVVSFLQGLAGLLRPLADEQLQQLACSWEEAEEGALQPWDVDRADSQVGGCGISRGGGAAAASWAPVMAP